MEFFEKMLKVAIFAYTQPISNSLLKMAAEHGQNFFFKIFKISIDNQNVLWGSLKQVHKLPKSARKAFPNRLR